MEQNHNLRSCNLLTIFLKSLALLVMLRGGRFRGGGRGGGGGGISNEVDVEIISILLDISVYSALINSFL